MKEAEQLREYNRWRRGAEDLDQPDPKVLGELLEAAADRLEFLEREHQWFFEQWHQAEREISRLVWNVAVTYQALMRVKHPNKKVRLVIQRLRTALFVVKGGDAGRGAKMTGSYPGK